MRVPAAGAVALVAAASAAGLVAAHSRGSAVVPGGSPQMVRAVAQVAAGRTVPAEAAFVDAIAAAGGSVWVGIWAGNPIDAFTRRDQTAYLDFAAGRPGGRAALDHAEVVAVWAREPAARLVAADARFRQVSEAGAWLVFERVP